MKIDIGHVVDAEAIVTLNVENLIYSRALVQANSGGGKSGLLRVIAEQVAARIPTIIIDKEGEYHTLREKVDLVLVGEQGELPADPRSAALLARRLVELGASAVIDLSDFRKAEPQHEFVKNFLEALIYLPRKLWHPTFIIIDEAHYFSPEKGMGESVASQAVIDLVTLGRKRGFGSILATTRLAKLHKNAADANNIFIGRTVLDVDQSRAIKALGFKSSDNVLLRDLEARQFYAFGPDLNFKGVELFRSADCQTTIPRPGDRKSLIPPKASHVVKDLAEKLKDLPQQAEAEIRDLNSAKTRIREQDVEIRKLKSGSEPREQDTKRIQELTEQLAVERSKEKPAGKPKIVEKKIVITTELSRLETYLTRMEKYRDSFNGSMAECFADLSMAYDRVGELLKEAKRLNAQEFKDAAPVPGTYAAINRALAPIASAPAVNVSRLRQATGAQSAASSNGDLSGPERRILDAIARMESLGITEPNQVAVAFLADYTYGGGGFNNPRGALRTKGLVDYVGSGQIKLTDDGRAKATFPEGALTAGELQRKVLERLPGPERKILQVLIAHYPDAVSNEDCARESGYTAGGGGFNNPRGRLRSLGLIDYPERNYAAAKSLLFLE